MSATLRTKPLSSDELFPIVSDDKLRMSLIALTNRYSEQTRSLIWQTYQDINLMLLYKKIRTSGVYQHGSKDKVRRKIVEFPHAHVYDFINTVLSEIYGKDWLSNNKALRHELVRPWWVVEQL